MKYYLEAITKDDRKLIIRSGKKEDAKEFYDFFIKTHIETDFNITYPEEASFTVDDEANYLERKENSETDVELVAILEGKIVGNCSVAIISNRYKLKHRAEYGVSILKDYWGIGIGGILTKVSIDIAKKEGYEQLELSCMGDNFKAINLYKKFGFKEFGRNKKGFKSKYTGYQEMVLMALDLKD